jgi:hypothetical protein
MIRFDELKHEYWLGEIRLPSVTETLRAAGLIDTSHYTEHARDRGTAVHAAVLYDDQGDLDESTLDPEVKPYLEQWREFKKHTRAGIITSEAKLWSGVDLYAGTLDKYLRLNGRRTIIDIKTNSMPEWVVEQLGGYSRAWREMGFPVQDVGCLVLTPTRYRLKMFNRDEAEAAWVKAYLAAKELACQPN